MADPHDPILTEVLRNEFISICEEMALTISKNASNSMLRVGDFAATLMDRRGRGILGRARAIGMVMFLSVMERIIAKFGQNIRPGDVFLCNDPYSGSSHMPDIMLAAPIFYRDELVGFINIYSHQTDVGGRFPGGFSNRCSETYEEGLRFPNVKLYEAGIRNDALVQTLVANIRSGDDFISDIEAKLSGCWRGIREFQRVMEKYGPEKVQNGIDSLIEHTEAAARKAIAGIEPGDYSYQTVMRDDGPGIGPVEEVVRVTLRFRGDRLTVDWTGTAPQLGFAVNMPLANTLAMTYSAVHATLYPDLVFNSGAVAPIDVIVPRGTMLNPNFPAAVGGRAPLFYILAEAMYMAMAKAAPARVALPIEGSDVFHVAGTRPDGMPFLSMDLIAVGWGGRPQKDGIDGCGGPYTSVPAEMLERDMPVVVDGFGYVPDTAGPGKYRGSLAVFKSYRFLHPASVMVRTNRPFGNTGGLNGGGRGEPALNLFTPAGGKTIELPRNSHTHIDVKPGDRIHHQVGGTSGHGNPYGRDPELVLDDVRENKLSIENARAQYAVVIDPDGMTVEVAQTRALRSRANTAREQKTGQDVAPRAKQ